MRDVSGRIVKHLSELSDEPTNELTQPAPGVIRTLSSKPQALAIAAVTTGVTVAAGLGGVAALRVRARRRVEALYGSLRAYLDAARAGRLSVAEIDRLMNDLDRASKGSGKAAWEVASQLVELLEDYTARLTKANEMPAVPTEPELGPLTRLRGTLEAQRSILSISAGGDPTTSRDTRALIRNCAIERVGRWVYQTQKT